MTAEALTNRPDERQPHVFYCSDRAYYPHAAVSVLSLASSTRRATTVHIVSQDRCDDLEARLRGNLFQYPHICLRSHHVRSDRIAGAFVDRHITVEAYLRFLLPEILPESVKSVVYLDCDTIVLDDIAELAESDLGGKAVGAVAEPAWGGVETERRLAALGIRPSHRYVNSGVLVMDLDRWRKDGLTTRILDYVAAEGSRLAYHDQDALNAVLQDDIALLDIRWNLQPLMLGPFGRLTDPTTWAKAQTARRSPGIIHFTTAQKPWLHRVSVRDRRLYFRYQTRTAWRGMRPNSGGPWSGIEYAAARNLLAAGIDIYRIASAFEAARQALLGRRFRMPPPEQGRPLP